jgi:hypothetical protein
MAAAPPTTAPAASDAAPAIGSFPPTIYTDMALVAASLGQGAGHGHGNFPAYPRYYSAGYPRYPMMNYPSPPMAPPSLGFGTPVPTTALALPYGSTPPPPSGHAAPPMQVPPFQQGFHH